MNAALDGVVGTVVASDALRRWRGIRDVGRSHVSLGLALAGEYLRGLVKRGSENIEGQINEAPGA
jgi:hypothetical protein